MFTILIVITLSVAVVFLEIHLHSEILFLRLPVLFILFEIQKKTFQRKLMQLVVSELTSAWLLL